MLTGHMRNRIILLIAFVAAGYSCSTPTESRKEEQKPKKVVQVPDFSADSAYAYIEKQLDFGYRIPNTPAHIATGDYLVQKFRSFGAKVIEQEFEDYSYDGRLFRLRNIVASFNSDNAKRVMLSAHWDSREIADKDEDESRRDEPIAGANDGASGVAVLLEIARLISIQSPDIGVDIILFDGEDNAE